MSQYGYDYAPPHGYQTAQPYPYQAQQFHSLPSYMATEPTDAGNRHPAVIAQDSFEYNRNAIPGLGLGYPGNAPSWQQGWVNSSAQQSELPRPISVNHISIQEGDAVQQPNLIPDKSLPADDDDAMEEGELSEDQMEDIYEPREVEDAISNQQQPVESQHVLSDSTARAPATTDAHHTIKSRRKDVYASSTQPWEASHSARERSGSYSPYLSPRELQYSSQYNSARELDDTSRSESDHSAGMDRIPNKTSGFPPKETQVTQNATSISSEHAFTEAKTQAQQAILRLLPLKVGYQNYVDEGVDKSVLNDLFTELGLNPEPMASGFQSQARDEASKMMIMPVGGKPVPDNSQVSPEASKKSKDKSEERKDRIARLLAAKGSKAATVAPEANSTTTAKPSVPPATAVPPNKTQSEKSKLLQQKMEALRKAREANAKKVASQPEPSLPNTSGQGSVTPAAALSSTLNNASDSEVAGIDSSDQPQAISEPVEPQIPQSIPGLFLSSTPQPPHSANPRKRPVAADLNEASAVSTYKRPFGQLRESRPFLIDVSDDEDDAEMEIDSPEQRSPLLHRPTTPVPKTASFRDHPALSDNGISRQFSSPSAAATPTGHAVSTNGKYDLESMNRKIEDMKRKIAEAEARKKAKQSNNGTPSVPPSQQQSKEGSADPSIHTRPPLARAETEDNRSSASLLVQATSQITQQTLPKVRGQNRQINGQARSRVASERLPIVEARKKEQLAHLQRLQSEVARVEQEIADSIAEESRLREEADDAEAEVDDDDDLCRPESVPSRRTSVSSGARTDPIGNEDIGLPAANSRTDSLSDASLTAPAPLTAVNGSSHTHEERQDLPEGIVTPLDQPFSGSEPRNSDESSQQMQLSSPQRLSGENKPVLQHKQEQEHAAREARAEAADQKTDTFGPPFTTTGRSPPNHVEEPLSKDSSDLDSAGEEDVAMEEVDDTSSDEDSSESSDDYEPTGAITGSPSHSSRELPSESGFPIDENTLLETTDTDAQSAAAASPVTEPISTAKEDSVPEHGEVDMAEMVREPSVSPGSKSTFVPYETPLQYFRSYRFHPNFEATVSGGLRSLTYSNMIDVKREVCPDQLVGAVCPRGSECEYQHLDKIKAPDDQILLQLGAYGNYEGEQKQRYIEGLRELLTGFRNRDIKDFQAISQGIIEYRTQFHGDKTKILPLGNVSI